MKKTITFLIVSILIVGCYSSKTIFKKSFSSQEIHLIMNADSLKPMRIYKINNKEDSLLLRKKSSDIKPNPKDLVLKNFVKRLYSTVRDSTSLGVGIAAPQVGILKNIIWVQRFDKENFPFELYFNPKIISYSEEKQILKEGCLSIPERTATLNSRSYSITMEYDTIKAEHITETIAGFTSVVFQHEIDHLNGILYLDHLAKDLKK